MTIRTVGPSSDFASIAAAMSNAGPGDTIQLEAGYSNETATVLYSGMTIFGGTGSTGIVLHLSRGTASVTLTGTAPIRLHDAGDGNGIVGNAGNNHITVSGGVDAVDGGQGVDRLIVDYRNATGAVSGDSTSNFTEAGGGGRMVTMTDGTIESFTILTGSGADTITTAAGNDIITTGDGASTVSAGQGHNIITGGRNADTVTALDGGNLIHAGNGANTVTTGGGIDAIFTGKGSDTVVSGGGDDRISVLGGTDSVDAGAGNDRLVVDYSAMTTDVIGGITGGNGATGYVGHIADQKVSILDFQRGEDFTILTGSGNDSVTTGDGDDVLRGNLGNDVLASSGGADRLSGGGGHDILRGGRGGDVLSGGAGADMFVFRTAGQAGAGTNHDTILDFRTGTDRIDLSAIDADTGATGDQSFDFIRSMQFSSHAGELRLNRGLIMGDIDGDGHADFAIGVGAIDGVTQFDFAL